jgi:DNA-binding transcriptional MerR regulator/mannose-6-phosphate isomerase-like protein (cupin superfamily)
MNKSRSHRRGKSNGSLTFTISEASRITNISHSTLRIWESAELIRPARTRSGYRTYSPGQIERLKQIQRLRTEKNLNVAAIRHFIGPEAGVGKTSSTSSSGSSRSGSSGLRNLKSRNSNHTIGDQLRRLREKRELTIFEAAERTGLSSSYLSSLERGQANASVATLQQLSVFYQTNVLAFFNDDTEPRKLVRRESRKHISNEPGIDIELLASGSNIMEPHIFRLAPGAASGGAYHHQGEEFIFVLEGCCEIWLDEMEQYSLCKGDSLYFSSSQAHRWRNAGKQEAVLFWINTPPTF